MVSELATIKIHQSLGRLTKFERGLEKALACLAILDWRSRAALPFFTSFKMSACAFPRSEVTIHLKSLCAKVRRNPFILRQLFNVYD
jgi:hypothetical protein